MGSIKAALAAIESLEPGEKLVYTHIAAKYSINCRTLARRHQGISASRDTKAQNRSALYL
jgi:hypothetical protein